MDTNNFPINAKPSGAEPVKPINAGPQKMNLIIIGALVLVLLLVIGVFFFWQISSKKKTASQLSEEVISSGLGAQLLEKAQNPIKDKLPETNPFQEDINPLKDVYQNPF